MGVPRSLAFGVAAIWCACGGKTDAPAAGSAGSGGGSTSASSMQSATGSGATGGSSDVGTVGGNGGTGGDIDPGTTGGGGRVLDASTGCSINSDCNQPLVCAFHRCHSQCQTTRDCPMALRCVHARDVDTGALLGNVCQLSDERACARNAECPPTQVCAVDGQCRDLCDADRDCLTAQVCRVHTCAETFELNAGDTLDQIIDGGTKPDGAPLRDPDGG